MPAWLDLLAIQMRQVAADRNVRTPPTDLLTNLSNREVSAPLNGRGFRQFGFHLRDDVLHCQAVFLPQIIHIGSMLDELIGPANSQHGCADALFVEQLE